VNRPTKNKGWWENPATLSVGFYPPAVCDEMPGRCQVYLTEPLLACRAILASSSSAICTEAHTPCDQYRVIRREQSRSQDRRRYNARWRFGRDAVEGRSDAQRTDEHRGRENERHHGDPPLDRSL
jgi:hypothetical protein